MTTPTADIVLIELRAGGKFHGQLDPATMLLTVCERDRVYVYDLAASIREGRSVVADYGLRPRAPTNANSL